MRLPPKLMRYLRPAMPVIIFLTGYVVGYAFRDLDKMGNVSASVRETAIEKHSGQMGYTNPLLECADGELISHELLPFREKVEERIDGLVEAGKVKDMAVYFRDLNDGPWFGINEKENFYPASLMKIPVMMTYLKAAETNPRLLDEKIRIPSEGGHIAQYIEPTLPLKGGHDYTVGDLMSKMIIDSDNDALDVLFSRRGDDIYRTYRELGIDFPLGPGYNISVKKYASFFRVLFNASYLNVDSSNIALDILSRSGFRKGIVSGVPSGVLVAHKFGEIAAENSERQFHDCGIVYYPKNPYILCVMSKGKNPEDLISAISDISGLVYNEVGQQMRGGM